MPGPLDAFKGDVSSQTGTPSVQPDPSLLDQWNAVGQSMQAAGQTNSRSYYEAPFFDDLGKKLNAAGYHYKTQGGFAVAPQMVPFGGPVSSVYQTGGYMGSTGTDVYNQMDAALQDAHAKGLLKDVPSIADYEKQAGQRMNADAQQSADILARGHGIASMATQFGAGMYFGLRDPAVLASMLLTDGVGAVAGKLAPDLAGTAAGRIMSFMAPQTSGAGTTGALATARETLRGMAREGTVFAGTNAALLPVMHDNEDFAGIGHTTGDDLSQVGWSFLQGAGMHLAGATLGGGFRAATGGIAGEPAASPQSADQVMASLYPSWAQDMRDFAGQRAVEAGTLQTRAEIAAATNAAARSNAVAPPSQDAVRHAAGATIDAEINPFVDTAQGKEVHGAALAGARSAFATEQPVAPARPFAFPTGSVAAQLADGLRARGLTDVQARGVAAGIMAESRGNPNARNPDSGAFGYGQWLGDRAQALKDRYGDKPTPDQQLDFLVEELRGRDPGGASVLAQHDDASTMRAYIERFMRPKKGAETDGDIARGMAAGGQSAPGPDIGGSGGDVDPRAALAQRLAALDNEDLMNAQGDGDMPNVRPDAIGEHVPGMPATDVPFDKPIWPQMVDPRGLATDDSFPEHGTPTKGPGAVDVFERSDGTQVIADGHGRVRDAIDAPQSSMVLAHVMREADGWREETAQDAARMRAAIEGRLGDDEARAALGKSGVNDGETDQGGAQGRSAAPGEVAGARQREGGGASRDAAGDRAGQSTRDAAGAAGPPVGQPRGYDPGTVERFDDPAGEAAKAQADMLTHDYLPREAAPEPGAVREPGAPPKMEAAPEAQMPALTRLAAKDRFAIGGEGSDQWQSIAAVTRGLQADADALTALKNCL